MQILWLAVLVKLWGCLSMVRKTELEKGGVAWDGVHRLLGPQSSGKALLVNKALVTSTFWPRAWGQAHMSSMHH